MVLFYFNFLSEQGGDRVAWTKQWIASPDIWTFRANFDSRVRRNAVLFIVFSFVYRVYKRGLGRTNLGSFVGMSLTNKLAV